MESPFIQNNWYVAAWAHEVGDAAPFGRRILGKSIALCRLKGTLVAVEDRCLHRGMPLSKGRIVEDTLQCAYHGLRYDGQGQCIKVPGQERVPPRSCLRSFPVCESDGMIWIWMGDAAIADPEKIPRFPLHEDPNWLWQGETVHYEADHLYVYDNLLDLTHVGYVHQQTIGGQEESHSDAEVKAEREGARVIVTRWMRDVEAPPTYKAIVPFTGKVDRWQRTTFLPGIILISVGAEQVGGTSSEPVLSYSANSFQAITPESEGRTHYFWSTGVDRRRFGSPELAKKVQQVAKTFEEDREVIEAQYARVMEEPDRPLMGIRSDGPSLMARRILSELLAAERAGEKTAEDVTAQAL